MNKHVTPEREESDMTQVAKIDNTEIQQKGSAAITPMEMIADAVSNGQSLEVVEKLMNLQERWEASQGRKAFDKAIAAAKAEIRPIVKNTKGHNSEYANLAAIADGVDDILSSHGLSYRYKSNQDSGISVTCILSHEDGYSEETTLTGGPDTSGSKNSIQAIGSTITYLQRYTVMLALGLSTTKDDDGAAANLGEPITPEQCDELLNMLQSVNRTAKKLAQHMRVPSLDVLPVKRFEEAKNIIQSAKGSAE